jgi:hypothetical protein
MVWAEIMWGSQRVMEDVSNQGALLINSSSIN